jgi:PAS domain S-box-containing protein
MKRIFSLSFRARLFLFIFLALIAPFALIYYNAAVQIRAASEEAEKTVLKLVRLAAQSHEQLIDDAYSLLFFLSRLPLVDPPGCRTLLSDLPQRYSSFVNFAVSDPDGKILCSSAPFHDGITFSNRPWFKEVIQQRSFVSSDYLVGRITNRPSIIFALPTVGDSGAVRAVLSLSVDLSGFNTISTLATLPPGSVFTVIDKQGIVLARQPHDEGWVGKPYPESSLLKTILAQGHEGVSEHAGPDGIVRLYAFTSLGKSRGVDAAYLNIGIPKDAVYINARQVLNQNLLWMGLVTVLVLAAAFIGSRLVLGQVEPLVDASKRLAARDFAARTALAHEPDEIGHLAEAFDRTGEALQKREEDKKEADQDRARLAGIVESSNNAIIVTDLDGTISSWNKGAERIYRYSAEEVLGRSISILMPPESAHELHTILNKIRGGEVIEHFETTRMTKDGSRVEVSITVSPVTAATGIMIGASDISRDVTEAKRAAEIRAQLAAIVESSNDAIIGRDVDGTVTSWNKGAENLFGYSSKEMVGRTTMELVPPDQVAYAIVDLERTKRGERVGPYETVRLRKDGKPVHVSVTVSPIIDGNGQIIGGSAIMRDISERKRAEDELKKQNEILQEVFDHIPVMINFTGADGRIKLVNRAWERTLGWTVEEIERKNVDILTECYPDPHYRQKMLDLITAATGEWDDFKTRVRDGRIIETTWAATKLSDDTIIGIGADITERKRTGKQIQALHQVNLAITSTLELPIILQFLLQKIDILMPFGAAHIRLINPSTGALESLACRNIDQTKWRSATGKGYGFLAATIISSKKPVMVSNMQTDGRVMRRDLYRELGLVSYLGLPLMFNDEVIGILAVFTEKEHEFTKDELDFMKALAEQASIAIHNSQLYEQSQKLAQDLLANQNRIRTLLKGLINARDEEAERIARVLHDESGQLLAAVYIMLDELARAAPAAHERVQKAKQLLDRIEERLRNLSHELHPTILNNLGFQAALDYLTAQMSQRSEIRITTECATNGRLSPPLDLTLYRVIQEALNNAIRHSKASHVRIRVFEDEPLIQCSIEDDGVGFEPSALSHQARHAGLGLAGIRERVESLNGNFDIFSAPGAGTKLFVTLPQEIPDGAPSAVGR